jgi:hypothetical protein
MRALMSLPGYLLFVFAMLKVFVFPATERIGYRDHPLAGMTTLEMLALIGAGTAWLRWIAPALHLSVPKAARSLVSSFWRWRWQIAAALAALLLIMGVWALSNAVKTAPPASWDVPTQPGPAQQTPPAQAAQPSSPPDPFSDEARREMAYADAIERAGKLLRPHASWDELNPPAQDTLCAVGAMIRADMEKRHEKRADLYFLTERAIYDITAPKGRCP